MTFHANNADLNGQTVLLTGGTGSFGTAFTRRMLKEFPDITLRIFSRDELKQSEKEVFAAQGALGR